MSGIVDRAEIVSQVVSKLTSTKPDLDPAEVERIAQEELDAIAGSPVQDFLLVLTERATKRRLNGK
jgi:hypothetical protein